MKNFLIFTLFFVTGYGATFTAQVPSGDSGSVTPHLVTLSAGEYLRFIYSADDISLDVAQNPVAGFTSVFNTLLISKTGPLPAFAGPVTIRFRGATIPNNGMFRFALVTYERTSDSLMIINQLPHTSIVIPSNASGVFDVSLERSVDLINWSAIQPGAFSSSASGQFFRARITQR